MDGSKCDALHNLNLRLLNSFSSSFPSISQAESIGQPWPTHVGQKQPKAFKWPDLIEKHQPSANAQDPLVDFNIGDDQHVRNIKVSGLLSQDQQESLVALVK